MSRYAVYICGPRCDAEVCPCTPRVCAVYYIEGDDGEQRLWVDDTEDPGYAIDDDPRVTPCVHGQLGVRYPHPVTDDGRPLHLNDHPDEDCLHQWADGDTDCVVVPYDMGSVDDPPITLTVSSL